MEHLDRRRQIADETQSLLPEPDPNRSTIEVISGVCGDDGAPTTQTHYKSKKQGDGNGEALLKNLSLKLEKEEIINSGLSFFKIITSSQKLRLPSDSVARLQRRIIDPGVILRDVHNNLWAVEIERDGDEFWFKKGWPQFHEANSLETTDFVVFSYERDNLFDFRLFGGDACEKKAVEAPILRPEEEEVDEESTSDDYYEDGIQRMEEDEEDSDYEEELKSSKRRYEKGNVGDWYGADIFESGLAIRPQNPYFVSRTRKPRDTGLHIPKDVIAEQKLKIPPGLLVVDGSGRKWDAKVKFWKDGRVWCTRGWRDLCRANNIGVDDACICEFVQQGQTILYMLVQPMPTAAS